MTCNQCGAEIPEGGYFCGACGRPVGYGEAKPSTLVEEVGLEDVPAPEPSHEKPEPRDAGTKRALCGICLGAFPTEELSTVDGQSYCPDCSPIRARHSRPDRPQRIDAPVPMTEAAGPRVEAVSLGSSYGGGGAGLGRGRLVFALLLLGVVAAGAYLLYGQLTQDRVDELLAGVDDDRTDARYLINKYRSGETLGYDSETRVVVEGDMGGVFGGEVRMEMVLSMGMDMETLAVDGDGNGDLRVRCRDNQIKLDVKVDGQSMPLSQFGALPRLPDFAFRVQLDPFGSPVGDIEIESGEAMVMGGMGQLENLLRSAVAEVPRRHLKVGDSWKANLQLPNAGGDLTEMFVAGCPSCNVTYEVVGYKQLEGRDCMVVSILGELDGTRLNVGVGDGIEVDGRFKGALFHDCDAGVMVKSVMDVKMDMSGTRNMKNIEVKVNASMDVTLKSVNPGP